MGNGGAGFVRIPLVVAAQRRRRTIRSLGANHPLVERPAIRSPGEQARDFSLCAGIADRLWSFPS